MILLCKALYRAFAVFVQSSLQVVCHAGVQDSISFVGQKVDIILFHALTAFLGVEFAEAFLLSERVLRDCHVASLLAMTNRGASTVLTAAGTDRGVPSRDCHVGLRPPRNDKSGGQHCFNGGQYGLGVPSRDCHVGLRPPRNDKSGSRYDQLNLPRILRSPPYWKSPRRR